MAGSLRPTLCEIDRVTGRPLFKAVWPVLRRGAGSVQFGSDPSHATVVEGLLADEVTALEQLDGTRELPAALRTAGGRDLLGLLLAHRLVVDATASPAQPPQPLPVRALLAPDAQALLRTAPSQSQGYAAPAVRRAAHVLVVGRGDLPHAVATQLRRAGVGSVRQGAEAADDCVQGEVRLVAGARPRSARGGRPGARPPALVVVVGGGAVDSATAVPWRARGIPVLPVVLHGVEAVVGPVVEPGGPCLRCLDLARADLDPAWPAVLGQLLPVTVGAGPEVSGETTLVGLAASMAAMVALAVLDGQALPTGRSLEFSLPWPGVRQRQWRAHPRCGCGARSDASGQPADVGGPTQAMMAG
jgi:hypothetical protein